MKTKHIFLIIGIGLLVLICLKIFRDSKKEKTDSAKPQVQAVQAECCIAKDTLIDFSFKAVGSTRANESVVVVSEIPLRLLSIHFKEGSRVKKGDLLFQLDDSEWTANIKKVKARLELAVETEKRNKDILESGGISQQAYDEAVMNRKVLEAEVESLEVMIGKAKIRAPFSGMIGIRTVSEGAFLNPGKILTTLEDLTRLKIDFTIPESYANMVHKGDRFNFRVEGSPRKYTAVIDALSPSIDTKSGNLDVLAVVENPDPALKAGVTVSITLVTKSTVPTIYVPTQALIPTPGGYHIYTLKNGNADYRSVTTGIRSETMVEIVSGINQGDSVLVTGFMKVRPDSKVKIIKTW